jgi:subtilisin family serine protease
MPTQDTKAAQFVERASDVGRPRRHDRHRRHGISLDHPSLTTTSTGERKVIDWVTGTDPLTDPDPTWINMQEQVSGASFTWNGEHLHAPAAGQLPHRLDQRARRASRRGARQRPEPRRQPGGSSGVFAILWNTSSNQVWVDTNQNRSFADQSAMTDYAKSFDVGFFGTDNPATAVAERLPFVVQTDGKNKYVNIGIVSGAHGSHVAGIAAGNKLFGGQMSGAAPGAKIVSSRACLFVAGCTRMRCSRA